MSLEIKIQHGTRAGGAHAVIVKLNGSLDTATAPDLEKELAPALKGSVKDVAFDLAELRFISSAGLRVFSATRKTLKERGGQVSFVNMQPQIREVFAIIQALPGVAVFESVKEMDDYLAARQRAVMENNP